MTSNQKLKDIYAAIVAKAQSKIAAGEKATLATDVGNDIITVGQSWTKSLGDDGKISDGEAASMNAAFAAVVDKRIPDVEIPSILWDGLTIFGWGFKGLRFYLNKWFDLGLA